MMENARNPLDQGPQDSLPTPLVVLGTAAVTAGVVAFLAWPVRRSGASREREALVAYLRDHLGGADTAIRVVDRLGATHAATQDGPLFRRLAREFAEDRAVVRALLTRLGASERSFKRAAGYASGTVLSVTAGGEPGDLALFRTLEALAIGIQGKRCLWRALQNLDSVAPVDGSSFVELEARAVRQWKAVDERRRALVTRTFSGAASRTE